MDLLFCLKEGKEAEMEEEEEEQAGQEDSRVDVSEQILRSSCVCVCVCVSLVVVCFALFRSWLGVWHS